jgi:hypothetical protein
MTSVPSSLRAWFAFHCVVDLVFAIPLFIAPVTALEMFGWTTVDPLATRLVAAALVGIGVESYLGRHGTLEQFRGMLRLKVLWSLTANAGIALSIAQGAPPLAWLFQAIFIGFSTLWITYALRLARR